MMVRVILKNMHEETELVFPLEFGPYERVRVTHEHLWGEGEDIELIAVYDTEMDRWVRTETIRGTDTEVKLMYTDFIIEPVE